MITPQQLVNDIAPQLGAAAVAGDAGHVRFMVGAHVAHLRHTTDKRAALALSVESIPHASRREALPIEVPQPPIIEFAAEGRFERLGKALGLNKEFQSGDPIFDAKVYIHSDGTPDEYLAQLLQHPGACAAIMRLLERGHALIRIDAQARGGAAQVSCADFEAKLFGDAESIREQAASLAAIADAIPDCSPRRAARRLSWGKRLVTVAFAWLFISVMFAVSTQYLWPVHGPSDATPWWGAGVAWLAASMLLTLPLRGGSRALEHLIAISAMLLIAAPCTVVPGMRMLNALADTAPRRVVEASVDLRVARGTKSNVSYFGTIDLKDGVPPTERSLSSGDHDTLKRCAPTCRITVGAGAFGWPWIDEYNVPAAGPDEVTE
jgi:hypothetical protein